MKRRLITSALPYVNNVPHLGNLLQVLSADVFARFCRSRGYDTLNIGGTDEYGTTTETKAQEEGLSPRELCDRFHALHREIYNWFGISFDRFGRTSTEKQTEIVQDLFLSLDAKGYILEHTIEQLYCESCQRFLADRFVRGTCPHCGYIDARGDQCEHCGKLLEPVELCDPKCSTCQATPRLRSTKHLYLDLPAIKPRLEAWISQASHDGFWANNAIQMTTAWIRDGLHERCITRDLKWGIPVPKQGFEDKVFYVWFDAPIGYLSITACHTDSWKSWWQDPQNVELYQFIGKDNIPFHTVIFPSCLLADGRQWTMLHHMSSTEYLNYEGGKFSKSKGVGVFGNDAMESGIPADVWRFYLYYNRPEKADVNFTWSDFQEKVNGELIGNLGNLINRTLTFVERYYGGTIPQLPENPVLLASSLEIKTELTDLLEAAELREGIRVILRLSSIGNKAFQDGEPWKTRLSAPEKASGLIAELCYLIRDLAIMVEPYLPHTTPRLLSFFGYAEPAFPHWDDLGVWRGLTKVSSPQVLFSKLDDERIHSLRQKYSGMQSERQGQNSDSATDPKATGCNAKDAVAKDLGRSENNTKPIDEIEVFKERVRLKVAQIVKVDLHPKAERLYIETIDEGEGHERVIVSGLVRFYKPEELLGKRVILVANLRSASLRGVESHGMLLAASRKDPDGKSEEVELLEAPWAECGCPVYFEGQSQDPSQAPEISIDDFFSIPITAKNGEIIVGGQRLCANGRALCTSRVKDGQVG